MADRSDPNHGFRKFLNDPKTSVMGYIAENIPADRLPHAAQVGRPPVSPRPQYADMQLSCEGQDSNQGYQNQQEYAQSGNGGLGHGAQGQWNGLPGFSLPPSFSEPPTSQGYIASNLSQHQVDPRYGIAQPQGADQVPHQHSGLFQSFSHLGHSLSSHGDPAYSQELGYLNASGQAVRPSSAALGQGPPLPGARRKSSPQSASRTYHRMILEFESNKNSYYTARAQNKPQEISTAAYELESLSQKIWTLRRDHAGDFEEYSDLGHTSVIASWQAQYELWADTVLDLQDAQTLGGGPSPWSGDNGMQSGGQPGLSVQQGMPGQAIQNGPSMQQQNPLYMENSQVHPGPENGFPSQHPPPVNMQNSQAMQSNVSMPDNQQMQSTPPEAFPQSNPPMPNNLSSGPSVPFQQQMQNSRPPQVSNAQSQQSGSSPNSNPQQNQGMSVRPNMPSGQTMPAPNGQNVQSNQSIPPRQNMPSGQNMPPQKGSNMPQSQNMPLRQNIPPVNRQNPQMQNGPPHPNQGVPGPLQAGQEGGR